MQVSNTTEVGLKLRRLVMDYMDLFTFHQWINEQDRWIELLFALMTKLTDKSEQEIRNIVNYLDDLELLNIEELSNIPIINNDVDVNHPLSKTIITLLIDYDFTEVEAKNILITMQESTKGLIIHYNGKIQKYLRKYGEKMVNEFSQDFSFSKINEENTKSAAIYWLQNILNMPIQLKTKSTEEFCDQFNITSEQLAEEADKMDINIALLDDIIEAYVSRIEKEGN